MISRLAIAARFSGRALVASAALVGILAAVEWFMTPLPRSFFIFVELSFVFFAVEPLLTSARPLPSALPLVDPAQRAASSDPSPAVRYELAESDWVHGALLHRGVLTRVGRLRRVALTAAGFAALYGVDLAVGDAHYTSPWSLAVALGAVVAFAVWYDVVDNFYRAPVQAARGFLEGERLFWSRAEIGWDAESIVIRNNEGRFRYRLAEFRGWKEDASMILLYTRDDRYWRLPKRALEMAGRLADLKQLLRDHVPTIPAYRTVYMGG